MRRSVVPIVALTTALALAAPVGAAAPGRGPDRGDADLDVLFVGAHPDDEASRLSTYGQWRENHGYTTGVITITRGEGGGNAIGTEEGAELGIIREAEERRAVARAGIEHIYNLDHVDFWYNLSAPLTEEIWERDDPDGLLERTVRVLRMTRPEVIVTMNPGINHGHHQYAAWLAVEAFSAAADPTAFPEQLRDEGLEPWRAAKIFTTRVQGSGPSGPECESTFTPAEPTDVVYGVWSGRWSEEHGTTWAQVEREAQREYASQGWHTFPDVPTDPNALGCDRQTLIDSRVPFTPGNTSPTAMLEGALEPAAGGLPLGTEFFLRIAPFRTVAGQPVEVTVHARNGGDRVLRDATVDLHVPDGWTVEGDDRLGNLPRGRERTTTLTVTPPAAAGRGRVSLDATLTAGAAGRATVTGSTRGVVEVVPAVVGSVELHPDVARFREWTREVGAEQVDTLIKPRLGIAQSSTRSVRVDLTNHTDEPRSGEVVIELPEGFETDEGTAAYTLGAGEQDAVSFDVTHSDPDLPTADEGGVNGDYDFTVTTGSDAGESSEVAAFNLVPATSVPEADTAPVLDGDAGAGEYPGGTLDVSRRWEGAEPDSPEDASGTAKVSWHDDALYVLVDVTDDVLGAVVTPEDAKRHWRTDSVEIAVDPRGDSRDTSTTFKVGVFPVTDDPANDNPPAAYRDADNHQGPVGDTAPGMEIGATVTEPYAGYTIEARIPMEDLPAAVDPERMGLDILVYDSDTQDLTGQTRLGWSTFRGVQASPYRWGRAALDGYTPPPDRDPEPAEPIVPLDVALSVESARSVLQSAEDAVPPGGGTPAPPTHRPRMTAGPTLDEDGVSVSLQTNGRGTAHVFAWTGSEVAAEGTVVLDRGRPRAVHLPLDEAAREAVAEGGMVLVGFEAAVGGTVALSAAVQR